MPASLPPGQRPVHGFPRFGTHLHRPVPAVPPRPAIEIAVATQAPSTLAVAELAGLPRREVTADFHCVSGWSATGLRWEGVAFRDVFRLVVEPRLPAELRITHVVSEGLDGFQSLGRLEDLMAPDVLLADRLDGRPLDLDHGAPVRLLSPGQYGYMSTKHLCRIEVHATRPSGPLRAATRFSEVVMRGPLIMRHPRARVWEEERHPFLPARALRPFYRSLIGPGIALCRQRGSGSEPPARP